MPKNPSVKDYAGNSYLSGRRRTKLKDALSHRCRDCDKLNYTSQREWQRAAKPRCTACGGTLVESEPSEKRRLGTKRDRKARGTVVKDELDRIRMSAKCYSCGRVFEGPKHLGTHLMADGGCVYEYRADGKVANGIYIGTAFITRVCKAYRPWAVEALDAQERKVTQVDRFSTKREAESVADRINRGEPVAQKPGVA